MSKAITTQTTTYCNDGATLEPWTLADFEESNSEDSSLHEWLDALKALSVGGSYSLGGGATPVTVITRLT